MVNCQKPKEGSQNYSKAKRSVQKLHHRVADLKTENVSGMMANHKLAKAIGEAGLYEARRQLQYIALRARE